MRTTCALVVATVTLAMGPGLSPARAAAPAPTAPAAADPYLSLLPAGVHPAYTTWSARLATAARAQSAATRRAAVVTTQYAEHEPAGMVGQNDTLATAEHVTALGTATGDSSRVDVTGQLSQAAVTATHALAPGAEDNGSLPLATPTGIDGPGGITTSGTLGDGPHGSSGDGTNDFDVYELKAPAGSDIVADTSATTQDTDTILFLYDAAGDQLAQDDDGGSTLRHSRLTYPVTTSGTYYVLVAGYSTPGSAPADPFDSGSGAGGAAEGPYQLSLADTALDVDYYAVRLRPGDVLGATAYGIADGLRVVGPDGRDEVAASRIDLTALYPAASPLPGGGNTALAYVAEKPGWYRVQVLSASLGQYRLDLETYRPGPETASPERLQTVYLDFDPGRVNTGVFGGRGVTDLSPFRDFIARWGLSPTREGELIRRITAVVRENLVSDQQASGLDPSYRFQVSNSRYGTDQWGQPGVSRVLVGGTIDEAGLETIGTAEDVDPGNYDTEDQALVLLDTLSDPDTTDPASVNAYLGTGSDRLAFVARAVGNAISHEIGHLLGVWHTDPADATADLSDAGGGYAQLYGVGPDGVGGTADDPDVDFTTDTYDPDEGFTGHENALNVTAWANPHP